MRIYNDKVKIDKGKVKEFFIGRKKRVEEEPLTAVLYQDKNPTLAKQRDKNEKEKILPILKLTKNNTVLDIACGIGRWAEVVAPIVKEYVGIDFSEDFIKYAKNKYSKMLNVTFEARDALALSKEHFKGKNFDRIIIAGLLLYLNDEDVKQFSENLENLVSPKSIIYLREPIAVEERLSLDNIWSDDLEQNYSAIYRTRSQLVDLLGNIEILEEGEMYVSTLNNRSETKQYFFLFKYKNVK